MFYTYVYINPVTDTPFYVGKGQGRRAHREKNKYVRGYIRNLNVNGIFPDIVISNARSEATAFQLERDLIKLFGRKDLGLGSLLNFTDGGEGSAGVVGKTLTSTTRSRLSVALTGNKNAAGSKRSAETRAKISAAKKGSKGYWAGKKHSVEHRSKVSAAMKSAMIGNQNARK